MSQGINFTSLQIASSAATSDEFLIRLDNALSGANGFAQITVTNVEKSLGVYSTVQSNSSTWGGSSLPAGGTVNQILIKNSATAGDASWKNKRTTLTLATASGTSATISCNALSADQFVVSLSGLALSATFAAPISAYDAQIIMWNVRYTTNIARVLLASSFRTPATTLNWSISTNKMDIFAAKYNALDSKWDVISFAPGYTI